MPTRPAGLGRRLQASVRSWVGGLAHSYKDTLRANILHRFPAFERRCQAWFYAKKARCEVQAYGDQLIYRPTGIHEGVIPGRRASLSDSCVTLKVKEEQVQAWLDGNHRLVSVSQRLAQHLNIPCELLHQFGIEFQKCLINSEQPPMKVCVGSPGRFHTFDLAKQLARAGALQRLYTGYPRRKVDGLSPERVSTFPWLTVAAHGAGRLGFHSIQRSLNWPLIRTFDSWLSSRIDPCDVFHCLSSFGVASHRVAKARHGALTICDRGSSHIQFQDDIFARGVFHARYSISPYRPEGDRARTDGIRGMRRYFRAIAFRAAFIYR